MGVVLKDEPDGVAHLAPEELEPVEEEACLDPMQGLHYDLVMPVVKRFHNCAIYINARDHSPPHFHVRTAEGREAWVDIATLDILSSSVPRRQIVEALEWAARHRDLLLEKFEELNP